MNVKDTISDIQEQLGLKVDGVAGPKTWDAIHKAVVTNKPIPPIKLGEIDGRSAQNIATLNPEVRPYAEALIQACASQGITIKVISGTRTYEEQEALYEQGRTKPGPIVTRARPGYSNHNFGIAFDIGVWDGDRYIPESPKYAKVGKIGKSLGLSWGGDWTSIQDEPHFEMRPKWAENMSENEMLAELRNRKKTGEDAFA
jgi:peptidoglycan L-alanyl-D-glutamate endopeptidase CwlK